ncbi:MAG: polysaccharide deacetylase family protein, partial [Oscillospiraceae bacterium]|nr:polysaccharide deacetylase family protein [Oscillospiraceae bacterium]
MKKAAFFAVAVLLIAALLAAPLGANAEEDLTFLVVNNNVISFGPAGPPNVPVTRDGWMMAPLSPLTDPDNGLNLHSQWSAKDRRLTVYDGEGIQLTFEVGQGTAFSGEERYTAPIQRFTQFANEWYVPLELISDVFGLYYYGGYETDWGTMVRVFVNPPYDDATFVLGYGKTRIQPVYDDYFAVSIPSPVPSPYVSPNPGVTPAASPIPVSPSPTPVPSPTPPPPPELLSVSVYLTFDGAPNDATAPLLDYIESENLPALFFLPPESLHNFPQTARRIAERHQAGLLIGETDDPKGAILEGNTLLRETALVKTCL